MRGGERGTDRGRTREEGEEAELATEPQQEGGVHVCIQSVENVCVH